MAGGVSEVRAKFTGVISGFKQAVSGVRQEVSTIAGSSERAVNEANRSFNRFRDNIEQLRGAIRNAGAGSAASFSELDNTIADIQREMQETGVVAAESMARLERAVNAANGELGTLGSDTDLEELRRAITTTSTELDELGRVDLRDLEHSAESAEQAIQEIGEASERAARQGQAELTKLQGTFAKIGAASVAAGAVVGGGMLAAITVTEDYQKALNGVAAQTGATDEETAELGESMKAIYANNYGETFQEIGDTMAYAKNVTGLMGEELDYLTTDSLMLRDTFGYEMTESIRSADKLMRQFGLNGSEAMAFIAEGSQKGLDYAQDLLPTIDEYSVYFQQAGFDASQMFGVFENAKKAGVFNLDYAADAFKEFGIIMTEDSTRAADALDRIGVKGGVELQKQFAKGGKHAQDAMQLIAKELAGVEDKSLQTIVGIELFGTKFEDIGAKGVMEMLKVNDGIKGNVDALKQINDVKYNTVSEGLAGLGRILTVEVIEPIQTKVMPTLNNMINMIKDNLPAIKEAFSTAFNAIIDGIAKFAPTFESLFIIFKNVGGWVGSVLVVAFTGLASALAPIVNTVTSILAKFTEWEGFVPILNGIVAGILAYKTYLLALKAPMIAAALYTNGLAIATRLYNMALMMNPIGLIIGLLVGLGVALYTAYQKSEAFRNIVNGAWSSIKAGAMAVFNWLITNVPLWIENVKNFFIGLGTSLAAIWTNTVNGAKNIWGSISTFFTNLWNGIVSAVMPIVNGFVSGIVNYVTNLYNNVMHVIEPLIDFFKNTFENIKLLVLGIVGTFLNLLVGDFEGVKISLLAIWTAIKNQVVDTITALKETALRIFNLLKSGATNIFNGVKSFFSNIWNGIKSATVNTINGLKSGAINGFNALKSGASNAVTAMKNGITNTINGLKSGFTNVVNGIKNAAINGFNGAKTGASNAITNMKSAVSNGINSIKNFFTDMKSKIISTVKGISLKQIGRDMIQGLIDGIGGMVGKVFNKVKDLAKGVTDKIKGILQIKSPSRVFREIGAFIGQGLTIGIDKSKKLVSRATEALASAAMIEPDTVGIGSLTGDTLTGQIPTDNPQAGEGSGGGITTNYQAPLMHIEHYYQNDETDAKVVANGLYNLQQDHDRARGRKTILVGG